MSEEPVICYMGSMKGKAVVYVPDVIKVPDNIIKESFIMEAGHGKLMTIYEKHLKTITDLMIEKNLEPELLFIV